MLEPWLVHFLLLLFVLQVLCARPLSPQPQSRAAPHPDTARQVSLVEALE
jgi:hypothetical protein